MIIHLLHVPIMRIHKCNHQTADYTDSKLTLFIANLLSIKQIIITTVIYCHSKYITFTRLTTAGPTGSVQLGLYN